MNLKVYVLLLTCIDSRFTAEYFLNIFFICLLSFFSFYSVYCIILAYMYRPKIFMVQDILVIICVHTKSRIFKLHMIDFVVTNV